MSFIISPYNSFRFAKRDSLLPNYANQLHSERTQVGLKVLPYCQLVNNGDNIPIQIRTDYDGTLSAILYDNSNNQTVLPVVNKASYPNFNTYEFEHTFNINGLFRIIITGDDSVQDSVEFESEPIFVDTEHRDTLLIKYYNETNTEYIDYSTGIKHYVRVPSRIPDAEHEVDQNTYDNQNKVEKTYAATQFRADFTTGAIPEYLVRQITLAQGLFMFFINDDQYVSKEEPSSERFGQSTLQQLTLVCTEYEVPGVNDDDSQAVIPEPEDMANIYPINLVGVTGPQQITVVEDYMLDNIMVVLSTGTSATIKAGTTVGGDEVLSERTVNTAKPVYTIDREYLAELSQYRNAFNVYFTIGGVGSTVDINTIIKRY